MTKAANQTGRPSALVACNILASTLFERPTFYLLRESRHLLSL